MKKVQLNGRLIKELRTKHSYSQERLAEIVGVNLRTIQRIEAKGVSSLRTRGALAEALGVKPQDLDLRIAPVSDSLSKSVGHAPRWSLLAVSAAIFVFVAGILAIIINDFQEIVLPFNAPVRLPQLATSWARQLPFAFPPALDG